ncbi:unnamed protein product [Mycena citricolor]|uniref:Tautomerase cis-CaaD-like domain-containing protein n=1 Tax=Mycena citricolor TaxID=2018698 RepID=A0AAD2K0U0_9AGAR|nr:unnamed protein product [Mycena citricolor]
MPFHQFYTPKGLYSDAEKAALAKEITALYAAPPISLPEFYVVVAFIELEQGNFFIGADTKRADNMVRIQVGHVARTFPVGEAGVASKRDFMARYEGTLKRYTAGRGVDWEIGIQDSDASHLFAHSLAILIACPAPTVAPQRHGSSPT